ncbi:hypothetical protein [Legionella clemsonensis]|uniref:Uncharacterized protein n=1 Tax=Legionella clemsonensis TaxID=1867846 RepID=A0A222P1B9_9GAMM|nr:hypothetical protein [Legionella clemsonensis]ASQ45654.1 hypothetical protein clem_05490 [Legionella clemsonensis]
MRASFAQYMLAVIALGSISMLGNTAATNNTTQNPFQSHCIDSWMKRMDSRDKVDYKNFGEKYCECVSQYSLDTQETINKAMRLCMSQTLLQDTMDALENEVGLDKATGEDINEYCEDRFMLVFPTMDDKNRQVTASYCHCAEVKLATFLKTADSMTDKEYNDTIKNIASYCSENVQIERKMSSPANNDSQTTTSTIEDKEQ